MIRKEQITRIRRYFFSYLKHCTLKKIINLFKVEYRLLGKNPYLDNIFPHSLFVELSNKCNLRCPLCQMGLGKAVPRENLMSVEKYKAVVEPLKKYLFQIFLYNWGEPFLNDDIYEIIEYNTSQKLSTAVSSNFNVPINGKRLVESGLEHLILSCDGITQPVYEKYRIGGKLDIVLDNLRGIVRAKREAGSKLPYIEWQCLVTKWNEFQLDEIKQKGLKWGADEVRFSNLNFFSVADKNKSEDQWLPQNTAYREFSSKSNYYEHTLPRKPCFWLWRAAVVNVNGGITPCCLFDMPDWGNVFREPFHSIWNNKRYIEARKRTFGKKHDGAEQLICDSCTHSSRFKF